MSRRRKIILCVVAVIVCAAGWFTYRVVYLLNYGIPEAYAAWNTGDLLVEYMAQHDDNWPASWDDLVTWVRSNPGTDSRWGMGDQSIRHVQHLRELIAIDWQFNPRHPGIQNPVTLIAGGKFKVLFVGTEPNDAIRDYLVRRASTRPASILPTTAKTE